MVSFPPGVNPVLGRLGERVAQKVNFLQKRSSKIYVFAFLGPFATFLANTNTFSSPFRPDRGPTLIGYSFPRSPHSDERELLKQDGHSLTHTDFSPSKGSRACLILVMIHPNADYGGKHVLLSASTRKFFCRTQIFHPRKEVVRTPFW